MGEKLQFPDVAADHVPRQPEVTAWKRAARRHQNVWREARGLGCGLGPSNKNSTKPPQPVGSMLDEKAAEANENFLSDQIIEAVEIRLANPQKHQTLHEKRLRANLLSSMPMCFNLFGPLARNQDLAQDAMAAWFPDLWIEDAKVEVIFEWSPGRRDPEYLNDRTAFDVAFCITRGETKHLVGIETKYHEHPVPEKIGDNPRYGEVGQAARQTNDQMARLRTSKAVQLWRDHLLALVCGRAGFSTVKYVLVAPEGNPAWPALANDYLTTIPSAADTFEFRTIEHLLGAAPGLLPQEQVFRERYLDVTPI
ncbi:MAG: PGN_0703 family putative restriction endonuclease [Actinomycetota bacterium]